MNGRSGTARITLGAVVLDSPDHTGRYIARDIVGGWAYMVADREGDTLARGSGGCPGGLDVQIRCSFLLAANQTTDSARLAVVVESRKVHRTLVNLARTDPRVIAAIDNRPVSVMTRPDERASFQVKLAAERAAGATLQDRERADWLALEDGRMSPNKPAEAAARDDRLPMPVPNAQSPASSPAPAPAMAEQKQGWRSRMRRPEPTVVGGLPPVQATPRNPALTDWLKEFDRRISNLAAERTDGAEEK